MTTDERAENQESKLASVKRRNRWVLAVVILTIGALQAGLFDPALPKVEATRQDVSPQAGVQRPHTGNPLVDADPTLLSTARIPEPRLTAREVWDRNMTGIIPVVGKLTEWYEIHKMKGIIDKVAVGEASKMELRELAIYLGWPREALSRGTTSGADFVETIIAISPWAMLCLGGWALIHQMQKRRLV